MPIFNDASNIYLNSNTASKVYLNGNIIWAKNGTILSSGLITYFDIQNSSSFDGNGTIITDLDTTNNGTIVGTVPYTSKLNEITKYLTVSGSTSNYIRTNTSLNSSLSPANTSTVISVFVWVNPSTNGIILSEQGTIPFDSGWYDSQIQWISGVPNFAVWPYTVGTSKIVSSISAPLNQWHYVGFTYNGTVLNAYVNGQSAGTSTYARQTPYNDGGGRSLYYGIGYPTSTNFSTVPGGTGLGPASNFKFGALHVYNSALTSTQVLNNYNETKFKYGL